MGEWAGYNIYIFTVLMEFKVIVVDWHSLKALDTTQRPELSIVSQTKHKTNQRLLKLQENNEKKQKKNTLVAQIGVLSDV